MGQKNHKSNETRGRNVKKKKYITPKLRSEIILEASLQACDKVGSQTAQCLANPLTS